MMSHLTRVTVLACLLYPTLGPRLVAGEYPHLLLGAPSTATEDPSNKDDFLMKKEFFALSYNNGKGMPNWVSWRVTKADITGDAPRKRVFDPDAALPPAFTRVVHKDYTGSGFDRGHMCPHSDRVATKGMSFATFVMTNIIPQAPNVNQKAWNQLEIYCRDLVTKKNRRLYVASGPAGVGGRGRSGFRTEIGADAAVAVPAKCWKVVVVVDGDADPANDLNCVTEDTRVIAVVMPNDNSVGHEWAKFRTSVAQVEKLTRLTFFGNVDAGVRKALREDVDETPIPPPVAPTRDEE